MREFLNESWNTLCLLAPWLLFGALLAGLLHVALPANWLRKNLRGTGGVFKAVLMGVPLPLCSCGVIPAGIGLKKNGASDGAAIGFLISTPQTGVDSILVSQSFFGWPFAIFKMLLAAITGVIGGLFTVQTGSQKISSANEPDPLVPSNHRYWLVRLLEHSFEIIQSIWRWLVAGIFVSAAISVWVVPTDMFQQLSDANLLASLLVMLVISLPLYVCATASVPIAAALVAGGMPVAAALVFLIAGPATNFATIGAIYSQFGFRNTLTYLATIIAGSILGAMLFDWALGATAITAPEHFHEHTNWFSLACGVLLLGMFVWFGWNETTRWMARRSARHAVPGPGSRSVRFQVRGMNCQNCVDKIESSLLRNPNVQRAEVDLAEGTVVVAGTASSDTLREAIEQAGFAVHSDPVD